MKFFRNLLKGASLTTALFVFQACYGTPAGLQGERVVFHVVSAEDSTPIKDVAVKAKKVNEDESAWHVEGRTLEDGTVVVFMDPYFNPLANQFRFESADGSYAVKDTILCEFSELVDIRLQKAK